MGGYSRFVFNLAPLRNLLVGNHRRSWVVFLRPRQLSHDGKSGIFLSPQRGLVSYDSVSDSFDEVGRDDKRLSGNVEVFPETEVHTVFGDAYLLMNFLVKTGMADILKETFPRILQFTITR